MTDITTLSDRKLLELAAKSSGTERALAWVLDAPIPFAWRKQK